jgi:5-methyltetrahydrofolate--homocysteine methyltransferase
MDRSNIEATLRSILAKRIMIIDGAMGTMVQRYKFQEEDYRGMHNASLLF